MGEVMDANPHSGPDHASTLEAESTRGPTITPSPADPTPRTSQILKSDPTAPQHLRAEPSPTSAESEGIPGLWHGTDQWLCGENQVWWTNLEFDADGSVHATLSSSTDTVYADAPWTLSGNQISLHFETDLWTGTIAGNTIEGTFEEDNCSGVWSVTKE
jgi:hypothetical protein